MRIVATVPLLVLQMFIAAKGTFAAAANLRVQLRICTLRPVFAATTAVFCDSERGTRGFATTGRFVVVVVVVVTSAISLLQKYVVASRFMQLQTQSCRCKGQGLSVADLCLQLCKREVRNDCHNCAVPFWNFGSDCQ